MIDDKKLDSILIGDNITIREAMRLLSETHLQILLVHKDRELQGVICDGDIRRALLSGFDLETSISDAKVVNKNPATVQKGYSRESIISLFENKKISRIPVLDDTKIVDVIFIENFINEELKDNAVVIMVGGLGSRLRPLTDNTPKPMLPVAGKPLLERIVEKFASHGFRNFYFCVNYKSEIIKEYFGDGSKMGLNINYVEENEPLGTAGALNLLPELKDDFLVINGDILTKLNFTSLLNNHEKNGSSATMCVKEYEYEVPYGVVNTEGQIIRKLEEKPTHRFFVNAGIYVLNPSVRSKIPNNKRFDITQLFDELIKDDEHSEKSHIFPVHDYWLDIGRISDYEKAQRDFESF